MKAMALSQITDIQKNPHPLEAINLPDPKPQKNQILIEVAACGVCHTELDEIEGRTPPSQFPMILGHEVIGRVVELGPAVQDFKIGDRVGVGWIYSSCGTCSYCMSGLENLCPDFKATGRDAHGGYAELMVVPQYSAFPIPNIFSDTEAAPFLCAGAIGYRSLNLTQIQNGQKLGLTGFGASAHLVLKMVKHRFPSTPVYVFARSEKERAFAMDLGAVWAGDTIEESPEKLNAIVDTTPVWKPVVEALKNLVPGGRLVINAIRKEDGDKDYLQKLHYPTHLWMEREIKSVANVAPADIQGFLKLAAEIPLKPEIQTYPLEKANEALVELKRGKIRGAKVLQIRQEARG